MLWCYSGAVYQRIQNGGMVWCYSGGVYHRIQKGINGVVF